MKKYRKLLTTALCAAALVGASILGTMAYFTDNDTVTNTFTVGNVDITLDEAKVNEDGKPITVDNDNTSTVVNPGDDKIYDATELSAATRVKDNDYHLIPGHVYTKDPTVTVDANSEDCYVRMFVTLTYSSQLDAIFATLEGKTALDVINVDSSNWTYYDNVEDETKNTRTYEFRYVGNNAEPPTGIVAKSNTETKIPALFTTITVPGEMTKEQLATLITTNADGEITDQFKIYVVAQAIQADGFDTAEEAWGQFPTN